ncbi:SAM-dependent methyltransferase [Plantactinospora siamensis]|uniref:SAM-dependent methyltransferase n=1 Tax=Plantactinospora siamensis TaxID=555372 RepID=A0ABV6NQA3_9ACTN
MAEDSARTVADPITRLDTGVPHSARVWNYWLGGKDNFAADRAVGDRVLEVYPDIAEIARASRAFLARAIRYLAGEAGVRQFLDIGTGLPTADNTHEVAQRITPAARIVYVDNDPLVLTHARALLTSSDAGATRYVDADMHDTTRILAEAAQTLDLTQPVAVMLLGILGYVPDYEQARSIVRGLMDAMPSGSFLVVNDGTETSGSDQANRTANQAGLPYNLRTREQFAGFFDGLELVEPGVISSPRWRPDTGSIDDQPDMAVFCGVARKP